MRQNGKIYNENTGKVALQPSLWIKKTFGGRQAKADFHEFMLLKGQNGKTAADAPTLETKQDSMQLALRTHSAYEVLKNKIFSDGQFPKEYVTGLNAAQVNELKNDYPVFAKQYIEETIAFSSVLPAVELLTALGGIRVEEKIGGYSGSFGSTELKWNSVNVNYQLVSDGNAAKSLDCLLEYCCTASYHYPTSKIYEIQLKNDVIERLKVKPELQRYAQSLFKEYPLTSGYSHTFEEISKSPALMEKMRSLGMDVSNLTKLAERNLGLVFAAGM